MNKIEFKDLSLSPELAQAIEDIGYVHPSPIQEAAIPVIQSGKDIIGQAQTGTGKTAAFGIPLLETIDPKNKNIQALVMCPTRELALQVAQELKKLAAHKKGLFMLPVYGGEAIDRQIKALKRGVHVIIGTPGRILDHLERRTIKFDQIHMVVLDEADEMLNMGFREDIESILSTVPKARQTVLFSATMPKEILNLAKKFQNNPEHIKVTGTELTVTAIEQTYYEVKDRLKAELMSTLIDANQFQLMLVFCNTKRKVDEVVEEFQAKGYKVEGIHGDLRQNQRNMVMAKFRNGSINMLVASDVAARGIDVSNVDAVFNYDLPLDPEFYVHRIGRTGRAGKSGKAFSFVSGRDELGRLRDIEKYTKARIEKGKTFSTKDLADMKKSRLVEILKAELAKGGLEKYEVLLDEYRNEGITLHQLAAILLKLTLGEDKVVKEEKDFRGEERSPRRFEERGERSERGGERERRPRRTEDSGVRRDSKDMTRLFINVGKKDRVSPGDILGAITGETGIAGSQVGAIDIYDKFTFVDVSKEDVDNVVSSIETIKGKKVNVEVAKP